MAGSRNQNSEHLFDATTQLTFTLEAFKTAELYETGFKCWTFFAHCVTLEPVIYGQSCCICERRTRRLETGVDFPVSLFLRTVTLENYEPLAYHHQ